VSAVFCETSRDLPVVSVVVSFKTGSVFDPPGREGLARTTARMLRRGAGSLDAEAIDERIDALGADIGADASPNATTLSFEVIRRNLDPVVDLTADILARPRFEPEELAKYLREAQAEIVESRDSDRTLASRALRRTLFAGHPYGRRVAGSLDALAITTSAEVAAFHRAHLTRANALVAVSGDASEDEAQAIAERLVAGLPEGAPTPDPTPDPQGVTGRKLVFVEKADRTQTQLVIGGLGSHAHDPDHVDLLVANHVFGGSFTSRLMQEVRAKRGWSYGASSRAGFDRRREAFTMWAAPAATDAAACLALELELLEAWVKDGITAEELVATQNNIRRSHAFEVDTARKRVHQKLEEALFELPVGHHARWLDGVAAVTVESANAAVRNRIRPENLVIGMVATWSEVGAAIEAAIPGLSHKQIDPYDLE
jgi:zinc protease